MPRLLSSIGMSKAGAQFIIATHSPILLALRGAAIVQIEDDGILRVVDYDSCRTVTAMRGFLDSPQRALRYLLATTSDSIGP